MSGLSKEINGDLYEAKRTLALITPGAGGRREDPAVFNDYLAVDRSDRTTAMVARIRTLLDTYGSIEFAHDYARGIAVAVVEAYDLAFEGCPESDDARFVRALIPYMLGRIS